MLRLLFYVVPVAIAVYCTFDVLGADERRRRGVPTWVWVLVVVLAPVVGGVVWLLVSHLGLREPGGPARRRGPVAPDDDPEFLFRLEQERRRREAQRRGRSAAADGPAEPRTDDDGRPDDDARPDEDAGTTDAADGTPQP